MSKFTAAYLAGLIDGEGCLDFGVNKSNPRTYYQPRVRIALVDKWLIDWLKKSFGGCTETRYYKNPKYNTSYCWTLSGNNLKPLLGKVQPYLKLKKPQCSVLLKKIKIQEKNRGNKLMNNDVCGEIEFLHSELKRLNKRGK